ncbi:MAG: family 20 glycosylhydrolase [Bacteroidaceae bacterium]|nr:family 20 glycosylhydrolase [Bacteroidaceae bacterium]
MKIKLILAALCCGAFVSCTQREQANYQVIPLPQEINLTEGKSFVLDKNVKIVFPEDNALMQRNAEFLADYIKEAIGIELTTTTDETATPAIRLALGVENENKEAYLMTIEAGQVGITGASEAGVFYGIQTLRKSLPKATASAVELPAANIYDYPRFSYRGAHFDVSRHFFPVDSVKRFIDMLALHNINRFHWHLTDDQGWRIEIKKYPELTTVAAYRPETVIGRNSGEYDGIPHDGHYTQDDAREIVAYAAERHITVIPEIDLPGHMQAALAAYPQFGCTGGPYEVWKMWGVSENVLCAGNDETLRFIEDIFTEIIDIFPSEYIHVGGDECPKVRWASCPKCQKRIKQLGIKGDAKHTKEEYLQSFVINHAEKFLNSKGRQIIGWDEILEGGLAPNATVHAWRGFGEAIEAARQGHDVIMSPTTFMYFDYYQTKDTEGEPLAIGGYLPLEKVYELEPVPEVLTAEEAKHIIGAQANLWTEYIPTYSHVEYMELPRMAALAEVQWTMPELKNYDNFLQRIPQLVKTYDMEGYNYATHVFDVTASFDPDTVKNALMITLKTIDNANVHYTLDGTEPTSASPLYKEPIAITDSCTFKARAVRGEKLGRVIGEKIKFNKASMKPITMLKPINKQYEFGGAPTLVDGLKGNGNYKTGRWIAFYRNDMEAVIDLQKEMEISKVGISTCVEKGDWVFDVRRFAVAVSADGENFTEVAAEEFPIMTLDNPNGLYDHALTFAPVSTRYVKVTAVPEHSLPEWHGGKGHPAFLFLDEIEIQ